MTSDESTRYFQALRSMGVDSIDDDVTQALRRLQPDLHALRNRFQAGSQSSSVDSDYSGETTEAYLIASVPGFIKQAEMAFGLAEVGAHHPPPSRIGVFCCGPCPEVVALGELINGSRRRLSRESLTTRCPSCFLHPKASAAEESGECSECGAPLQLPPRSEPELRIHLELFDLSPHSWKPVRDEVLRIATKNAKRASIDLSDISVHDFDIRDPKSVERYSDIVTGLDLAIFQNFENELGPSRPGLRAAGTLPSAIQVNLERVARLLRPGSKMILSDLWYSWGSHRALEEPFSELGRVQFFSETVTHPLPNAFLRKHFFFETPNCFKTNPRRSHQANFLVLDRTDGNPSGQRGC